MSKIFVFILCLQAFALDSFGQAEKFDIISFTAPNGWQKEAGKDTVQLGKEDPSTGGMIMVTMFKPLPGGADPKENFGAAWKGIVRALVKAGSPQMQPSAIENGWTVESGIANYESDGKKGAVLLVTASGGGKMINVLTLTNTEQFQGEYLAFLNSIKLPPVAAQTASLPARQPAEAPQTARKSEFKFNTSNFDDGWTAVEEEDWVRATKGNITVLLHYPHLKEKEYITDQEQQTRTFWDLLVAPRYTNLKNFELMRYERSHEPGKFAAGNLTDQSGRSVYVVLFSKAKRGWVEIIAPDKNTFTQAFGTYVVNSHDNEWEPLQKLSNYNKFAVAASDLKGKWSTSFTGSLSYVNIYTGASAGMDSYSSAQSFEFGAGNTYRWQITTARTAFGTSNFQGAKSAGKFTVPSNWQVHFSDMEGKPKTYPAHFSCVKGARILWLDGTSYGKTN
ncbi:MAG: hypothetical protein ABL984_08185 [Pyrinomonadaceae bacterium]